MGDHIFEFLSLISTFTMVVVVPLLIYIWRTVMGRIDKLEKKGEKVIMEEEHRIDIARVEQGIERVEDRMIAGFDKVNDRMDTIMKMLANCTLHSNFEERGK